MNGLKFILLIISVISPSILPAQRVSVRAVSDNEPLPYAIIYINGQPIGAADSTGATLIPDEKLNIGDTVSASFVGCQNGSIVYNSSKDKDLRINLESRYDIETVTVTGKRFNMRIFLKKNVNDCGVNHWSRIFRFNFEAAGNDRNRMMSCDGNARVALNISDFRPETISFNGTGDTAKMGYLIGHAISLLVKSSQFRFNQHLGRNVIIRYNGIVDNNRIFILSWGSDFHTVQWLLRVNKDTKNIVQMEATILHYANAVFLNLTYSEPNKYKYIDILECTLERHSPEQTLKVKIKDIKSPYNKSLYQKYFPPTPTLQSEKSENAD